MKPMLATPIPIDMIHSYVDDDEFVVQQKVDGDRVMVEVHDGTVRILNRDGNLRSNPIPRNLIRQFEDLPGDWCFDGELLDELWLFDLPIAGDAVTPGHPYRLRLSVLERFFVAWQPAPVVRLLPTARTGWAKSRLVNQVMTQGGEGVVLKRLDAPYICRRSRHMLKVKATKTADCVVTGIRAEGRNNCHVSMFEQGHLVEVGSCAMLGKPKVTLGDVVEVKYLYADTNRRLVQSAFLRVRDDKAPTECTIDQLMFTDRTVITPGGFITVAPKRLREPAVGLGPTQVRILTLLALGQKNVSALEREGLSRASAYSALTRLGSRGLVDRKHLRGEDLYFLTASGIEVEKQINDVSEAV